MIMDGNLCLVCTGRLQPYAVVPLLLLKRDNLMAHIMLITIILCKKCMHAPPPRARARWPQRMDAACPMPDKHKQTARARAQMMEQNAKQRACSGPDVHVYHRTLINGDFIGQKAKRPHIFMAVLCRGRALFNATNAVIKFQNV